MMAFITGSNFYQLPGFRIEALPARVADCSFENFVYRFE